MGWDEDAGLGQEEGPYPEWQLPIVRWGLGPCTVLCFGSKGRPLTFNAVCGLHHLSWQGMRIILNGDQIHRECFDDPGKFHDIRVSLHPRPGRNRLVLEYKAWDQTHPNRPLALLFKRLQVVPC